MTYRPLLTQASRPSTSPATAIDETGTEVEVEIAGEHPLTLYVDKREIVTLMTLGAAPEALIIGYLRNQRLVSSLEEIAAVQVDWETDAVAVTTRHGVENMDARLEKRTVTSGCGQGTMFGDLMEDIERIQLPPDGQIDASALATLLDNVRRHESVYVRDLADGAKAVALFNRAPHPPSHSM